MELELFLTTTGSFSAKSNGRLIASSRDPQREAGKWVDQLRVDRLNPVLTVVGIGLGYHLRELFRRHPQIKVRALDTRPYLDPRQDPLLQSVWGKVPENLNLYFGPQAYEQSLMPVGPTELFVPACSDEERGLFDLVIARDPQQLERQARVARFPELAKACKNWPAHVACQILSVPELPKESEEGKLIAALRELVI